MTRRITAEEFRLIPQKLVENDIEKACIDLLHVRGYYVLRLHSGLFKTPDGRWVRIGEPGLPDYCALHVHYPGFLLEVKRPRGKPKPHQERKIRELRLGYRLAVVAADSARVLAEFLAMHERSP